MPPSMTAGSSSVALAQFFTDDIGLRQEPNGSALPKIPIIRFRWGDGFAASLVRCFAAAVKSWSPPCTDLTRNFPPANGDFYSRASGESVTLLVVGYNYGGN